MYHRSWSNREETNVWPILLIYLLISQFVWFIVCLLVLVVSSVRPFINVKTSLSSFLIYLSHFSISFTIMALLWLEFHTDWGGRLGQWGRRMSLCLVQLLITLFYQIKTCIIVFCSDGQKGKLIFCPHWNVKDSELTLLSVPDCDWC